MRNLALILSRRLSTRSGNVGNTGSVIAILGVAFAVAVMELTLCISSGFNHKIKEKLNGFVAPVTIYGRTATGDGEGIFYENDPIVSEVTSQVIPGAKQVGVVTVPAILKTDEDYAAIVIKGNTSDYDPEFECANIVEGRWYDKNDRRALVISRQMADMLGLGIGDRVFVCVLTEDVVKAKPFEITGIYDTGFSEFDKSIAYARAEDLRKMVYANKPVLTSIELHGIGNDKAESVKEELMKGFEREAIEMLTPEKAYTVESVNERGALYLNWLELLDTNVVVIFILMALVAASTLISSLFIQVLDKVKTIGLLKALGASDTLISRIFVYLSLRLVGMGMVVGNIIGLGLIFIQAKWHVMSLNPEMYYLDTVPVEVSAMSLIILNIAVFIAAWLILVVPARIATRKSPAQTLRFE